jgi:predicted DNA-binding transcriptional regulator AlpA
MVGSNNNSILVQLSVAVTRMGISRETADSQIDAGTFPLAVRKVNGESYVYRDKLALLPDPEIEAWIERLKREGTDLRAHFKRPEVQQALRDAVARGRRAPSTSTRPLLP